MRQYFDTFQFHDKHVYCNNAGGSQIPYQVFNNMFGYLQTSHVQLDCVNKIGDSSNAIIRSAKQFVELIFNNRNSGKIEFGCSTTQLATNLSCALPDKVYQEVVLCESLHYSMITPFERKSKQVKWWMSHGNNHMFYYNDLLNLINKDTTLVIIPHVSNITGVVFDVKVIVEQIRQINPDTMIMVDGVSYLPHDLIDVSDWDVDFYFVSFYKFLGPHIAALYIKDYTILCNLNHYFLNDHKLELGSFANEHLAGVLGIKEYIMTITNTDLCTRDTISKFFDIVKEIETTITKLCDNYFCKTDKFRLITSPSTSTRRFPIYSFTTETQKVENINVFMNELNIMTSCGKFHCNKFLKGNVLRISFLHYNTLEEVHHVFNELFEFDKSHQLRYGIMNLFPRWNSSYSEYTLPLSEEFKNKYNYLTLDTNYTNVRFRRYSLISTENMQVIGTKFYQSEDYNNTRLGGVTRVYKEINIVDDNCFHDIVRHFIQVVKQKSSQICRYCTVHQIRVAVDNDSITPAPEGIHQDGYSYVGILCVNRENIMGGVTKIYTLDNNEIYSTILKPGEMIILNDREVKHYVSNIVRMKNDKVSFRDVLVLTTVF